MFKGSGSVSWLPLSATRVCLDCDALFLDDICPRCANTKTWPLSLWLNRRVMVERLKVAR